MFRGFKINEGVEFERAVQQFDPELSNAYRGTSPRKQVPGTEVQLQLAIHCCMLGREFLCSMSSLLQKCPHSILFLNI